MSARLLLACGCEQTYRDEPRPCVRHGRQRVVRTLGLSAPRIRGVATGPHVTTEDLDVWTRPLPGVARQESE